MKGGEGLVVDVVCGFHNHDFAETLVGHPYVDRLTKDKKTMFIVMTKTFVKPTNILLTLKERNEKNVMMIMQVYNAMNTYQKLDRGHKTEIKHLMMLLE